VDARLVDRVLERDLEPGRASISTHHGWILNRDRRIRSLPADAFFGLGNGPQIVLVIPSQDIVAVRFGGPLSEHSTADERALEADFFAPLQRALGAATSEVVTAPSSALH
jgi:hypothetical protein